MATCAAGAGFAANGRLGYPTLDDLGNQNSVGDDETPGSVAPVDVGAGRTATAISAGRQHTCARLDDASVRCWGYGANGRLGYCNENSIGDDETPGSVGPVDLREPGGSGAGCPSSASAGGSASTGAAPTAVGNKIPVMGSDATRARGLRSCLGGVASHAEREKRIARRGLARRRARARRHLSRHARDGRRRCLRLYGRTPGRVTGLRAHALGKTQVELSFSAPGTDESHPPAARTYVVKQSPRPIRGARDFARARTLCKGACRFTVTRVGDKVSLTVTDLRPRATYYYALVARDNVSSRRGPRSPAAKVRTG